MAEDRQPRFRIVDVPTVHEIYANQFISGGFDGSSVTVTFGTAVQLPEKMGEGIREGVLPTVHVTARLAISAQAAVEFITSIQGMLEKSGLMRGRSAPAGPAQMPGDTWGR